MDTLKNLVYSTPIEHK